MISVVLALCFVTLLLIWRLRSQSYFWLSLRNIPGPKPLPLVGNALDFSTTTGTIPCFEKYRKEFGGICKVFIGSSAYLMISDVDFMEYVMSSNKLIDKSKKYSFLNNWLGTGLLTSNGNKWRSRRKMITPAFHFKILEQFIGTFQTCSNILIEKLWEEVDKSETNIYPLITLCTLDIICETAMGISINAQRTENSEYVKCVRDLSILLISRNFSAWKSIEFLYRLSSDYKREMELLSVIQSMTNDVIRKRRQQICNDAENPANSEYDGSMKKMVFLDLLLQTTTADGVPLSNEDIREEVDTFMFEGHDTTSSAVCFTLYLLANNPDIQEKVNQELEEMFHSNNEQPAQYSDLQSMKYLEMVIKESLRLYPIVPFFARNVKDDIVYKDIVIQKGVTLTLYAFGLHRNENIFPNPEEFYPERFSPENQNKIPPYSYMPFSAGPRNCIGQKFAMLEIKSIISKVLRNFKLKPVPTQDIILSAEFVLKSKNGIYVKFENR